MVDLVRIIYLANKIVALPENGGYALIRTGDPIIMSAKYRFLRIPMNSKGFSHIH